MFNDSGGPQFKNKNHNVCFIPFYAMLLKILISVNRFVYVSDTYDCLTSSGGMGDGHIPSEALYEMIRITKPGTILQDIAF